MNKKKMTISKNPNREREIIILYTIIIFLLVLLIAVFAFRSYRDYNSFKNHRDYFKNSSSLMIEPWMTPHSVLRHFNITQGDLFNTLNTTNSSFNFKRSISAICLERKENCTLIINELNNKVG